MNKVRVSPKLWHRWISAPRLGALFMDTLPTKSDKKRPTIGFALDEPHCLATVGACAVKGCFGVAVAVHGAYVGQTTSIRSLRLVFKGPRQVSWFVSARRPGSNPGVWCLNLRDRFRGFVVCVATIKAGDLRSAANHTKHTWPRHTSMPCPALRSRAC